jgi:hypothetical protein
MYLTLNIGFPPQELVMIVSAAPLKTLSNRIKRCNIETIYAESHYPKMLWFVVVDLETHLLGEDINRGI